MATRRTHARTRVTTPPPTKAKPRKHRPVELGDIDTNMRLVELQSRLDFITDMVREVYAEAGTHVRDGLEKCSTADSEHRKAVSALYDIAERLGLPSIADILAEAKISLLLPEDGEEEDEDGDCGEE